jgi:hypothetical protein
MRSVFRYVRDRYILANETFLLPMCGGPAISHVSHHVSLVQWTNLFASRHKGHRFKSPGEYLCGTGILLLALSRYIGDPDVIDHQQGFVPNNCH